MAALGRDNLLCQLTFGHPTPRAAVTALTAKVDVAEPCGDWQPTWIADLTAYAAGERVDLAGIEVDFATRTLFQQRILQACRRIPYGSTRTYGELATAAGYPRAARAVGNVMASNCVPLVIPCHRVVPSGGRLGGYSAAEGVRTKLRLLEAEGAAVDSFHDGKPRSGKRLAPVATTK
jgi:methylated-DNA-[protein]-cysteine S-methyltransferase